MRNIVLYYRSPLVGFNIAMLLNSKADGVLARDRDNFSFWKEKPPNYFAVGLGAADFVRVCLPSIASCIEFASAPDSYFISQVSFVMYLTV